MKSPRLAVALCLAVLIAAPAFAGSVIEVMHSWARPTLPNRPGVVYAGIHNLGDAADRLIGARAEGVARIELHEAAQKDGIMTMTPVDAVEIPAGGMAHLGPGGLHLMMFGIDPPLKNGGALELILIFEAAGEVAVTVPVSKTMGDPQHHGQGHQKGMKHQHGATGNYSNLEPNGSARRLGYCGKTKRWSLQPDSTRPDAAPIPRRASRESQSPPCPPAPAWGRFEFGAKDSSWSRVRGGTVRQDTNQTSHQS